MDNLLQLLLVDLSLLGFPFRDGEIKEGKSVCDEACLQLTIVFCFHGEGGCMVDLDQPRLVLIIHHDIEPEELKAQRVLVILRRQLFVLFGQEGFACDQSLDDYIINVLLQPIPKLLPLLLIHLVPEGRERPLMTFFFV